MQITDTGPLAPAARAIEATVGALVGRMGGEVTEDNVTFDAVLSIDGDASVPGNVPVLRPGSTHQCVVQAGPDRAGSEPRHLFVKIPDAYATGEDQDFLLASSGDGAPLHHAVLPSDPVAGLYSSLWLYFAGLSPILFGVRVPTTGPDVRFGPGDELVFAISPPVGRFRRVGVLTLGEHVDKPVRFSGGNSGGNIRPLPPVNFY